MIINIAKLNKELSALRIEKEETVKKMNTHQTEKSALEEQIRVLAEEKLKLEEKLTNFKKEEAAVVVAVNDSVNQKVSQKLASMGVPEGTVIDAVVVPETNAPTDVYKTYESLAGKDKVDFFKKNEKAILAAMKSFHYQPIKSPNGMVNLSRF